MKFLTLVLMLGGCATAGDARYWNALAIGFAQQDRQDQRDSIQAGTNLEHYEYRAPARSCVPQLDYEGNYNGCF